MSAIYVSRRTVENPLIKDKATFLETAAETNGARTLIRIELAPEGGNDLHYHKSFDETFTAIQGRLGIRVGKEVHILEEGQSMTAKAGQLHCFFNPSKEETILFDVTLNPGSEGFETTIYVAYGLAADGLTTRKSVPKNPYHLALLLHWGDTQMPGLMRWFEPVFRWLARVAIRKGIDRELIARYCQ
ncbi:MAG TPA: cupin domain-containing protein [Saprospiraceae bacterium]|nr:cupin domain-containing protein [Saprospiraceae bacterium]